MDSVFILWVYIKSGTEKKPRLANFHGVFSNMPSAQIRAEVLSFNSCREQLAWQDGVGKSMAENEYFEYIVIEHTVATSQNLPEDHESNVTFAKIADRFNSGVHLGESEAVKRVNARMLARQANENINKSTAPLRARDPDQLTEEEWKAQFLNGKEPDLLRVSKEIDGIQDAIVVPASDPPAGSNTPAAPSVQISSTPWKPHAG